MHQTVCIESDAQKDAGRALDMLHTQLLAVVIDPYSWKWALLVLHHTMQTIFTASLEDQEENGSRGARTPDHLHVFRSLRGSKDAPGASDLAGLFARVRAATGLQATEEVEGDLERLDRFHQVFVHRLPTRWELGIHGLPRIAQNCLRVVDQLGWLSEQGGPGGRHLSDGARAKLVASVNVLDALERQYKP